MSKKTCIRVTGIVLIVLILFVDVAVTLPAGGITPVDAGGPGPNVIVGLFRAFGALSRRNRIYREARATSQEINAYYDQLIDKTSSQRQELIQQAIAGEKPPEFVRSYVRLEAVLEAERAAAIEMVEQEKNQARINFEQTLVREFTRILIASPGGQKIVRDVRDTIARAREAAVAVQTALEGGKPIEALAESLAREVGDIPVIQEVAKELGSMAGQQLDQALGGVLTQLEDTVTNMQGGMGEAISKLDEIDGQVARYDGTKRTPISLLEDGSLVGEILAVDQTNAAVDVVASAFAGAAEIKGLLEEGTSRETMKDRIRSALMADRLVGLANLKQGMIAGEAFCAAVGMGEYQVAAAQLGKQAQDAAEPENATYLVCYDLQTGLPVYASILGADDEEEQATLTALDEATPTEDNQSGGDFPLGTHSGTVYLKTKTLLSETMEEELSILVEEDGVVSGSVNHHYWQAYTDGDGCLEKIEVFINGAISGQIEPKNQSLYNGPIEFRGIQTTVLIDSCGIAADGEQEIFSSGFIKFQDGNLESGFFEEYFYFEGE